MKKRFLALLLSLAMVFSLQPLAAYAEDDVNSSNETTEMQVDTQEETPNENIIESNNEQPPVETPAPETETPVTETETPPQTSEQPSASVNEETQTKAKSSMILKKRRLILYIMTLMVESVHLWIVKELGMVLGFAFLFLK